MSASDRHPMMKDHHNKKRVKAGNPWSDPYSADGESIRSPGSERPVSNVVFMGMGEPLQNYQVTLDALRLMLDDRAYGLSRRRVTVSTSGVVPMMDRLREDAPVALAVSLHAPNDRLRDQLVPLNRKYPLRELLASCERYLANAPRDFITFEYCMLRGVNDSREQARELISLVGDLPCKFNLIPFNPFPESGLLKSDAQDISAFAKTLEDGGFVTTVRKTRGDDIDAACGQLAGSIKDRTKLADRRLKNSSHGVSMESNKTEDNPAIGSRIGTIPIKPI